MARKKKRDEPTRQWTRVKMYPIGTLRAEELAQWSAPQDISTTGRDALMELICGIAAIDSQMERQEVAYQAIKAVYQLNNEHAEEVARWMAGIYGE
jgi:hypothetical protein